MDMTIREKKEILQQYMMFYQQLEKAKKSFVPEEGGCLPAVHDWIRYGDYLWEDMVHKLNRCVSQMQEESIRQIFESRYCRQMKWDDIAERLCYDRRWLLRLHDRALNGLSLEQMKQKRAGWTA